jgi:type IV secretory pathway TrbD component
MKVLKLLLSFAIVILTGVLATPIISYLGLQDFGALIGFVIGFVTMAICIDKFNLI